MQRPVFMWLLAAGFAMSCVGGSSKLSEKEKQDLTRYVVAEAPKNLSRTLNINYDNKTTLIGYEIEPAGVVKPGDRVKLTMYWKMEQDIGPGWSLFTHVLDASGERVLNLDDVGPIRMRRGDRQVLGPSEWQPGKVYVDIQEFTLPASVKTNRVQVVTGIWKGEDRLKIVRGPQDRKNAGIVANLATGVGGGSKRPRSTRTPTVRVNKLDKSDKIKIDGKLDEEVWRRAALAGPFVDVSSGEPNRDFPVNGSVKLLWNEDGLFLGFDVRDPDVVGDFDTKQKDPHLWKKDTVEVMVDPEGDGDNRDYYEIQINPQNLVFDSRFDNYNQPKTEPDGPFGHQSWSANVKSAVQVSGTLNKSDDRDTGYVVEAMIPWKSFDKAKVPPEPGTTWRMNFYAMQNNGGVAWSPILGQGNFHKASRFGRVVFGDKDLMPTDMRDTMRRPLPMEGLLPGKSPRLRVPPTLPPQPAAAPRD